MSIGLLKKMYSEEIVNVILSDNTCQKNNCKPTLYVILSFLICTEMRFILCTWFGEIYSCSCLTVLPGPAWVLLNKICTELISSLYSMSEPPSDKHHFILKSHLQDCNE